MGGLLKKFFIMCSGAERSVLADPRCAIERGKYASIGATVFSTAVLASLSGGYAVHTTFRNVYLSVCIGIVWGLIIFNLDRYIVSSLRKPRLGPSLTRRQRVKAKAREFAKALPRLLLAVFISVVITRPLELKLFEREINAQLETEKSQMSAAIERQKRSEFPQIDELTNENAALRQQVVAKDGQCTSLHEMAMDEAMGKGGEHISTHKGKGPLFEERWQEYKRCDAELTQLTARVEESVAANGRRIDAAQAEFEAGLRAARTKIESMDGLLARLRVHSQLTESNPSLALASWFIIILFILLETAPIAVKLLSERGPYEDVCETLEHEVYVSERRKISNINDETNTRVALNRRKNAALLAAESRLRASLVASLESLAASELREARSLIAKTLVEHWKGEELRGFKVWGAETGASRNDHRVIQTADPGRAAEPPAEPEAAAQSEPPSEPEAETQAAPQTPPQQAATAN
jgi:Domain of unknown function (DUF4407)